jgi:hypothetical protein
MNATRRQEKDENGSFAYLLCCRACLANSQPGPQTLQEAVAIPAGPLG